MSTQPLEISAVVKAAGSGASGRTEVVRGQVAVATTTGEIVSIELHPDPAPSCPQSIAAISEADWLVFGPGSWFTSVLPHLLVPELAEAIEQTAARRCVVLNLEPQPGETEGFDPEAHLRVLQDHAPRLRIDTVIADQETVGDRDALAKQVATLGADLVLDSLRESPGVPRHDPILLAGAFRTAFSRPSSR